MQWKAIVSISMSTAPRSGAFDLRGSRMFPKQENGAAADSSGYLTAI